VNCEEIAQLQENQLSDLLASASMTDKRTTSEIKHGIYALLEIIDRTQAKNINFCRKTMRHAVARDKDWKLSLP
jgi:hypothetical protein